MNDSVSHLLDSHVLLWWWFDPERLSDVLLVKPKMMSLCHLKPIHREGQSRPSMLSSVVAVTLAVGTGVMKGMGSGEWLKRMDRRPAVPRSPQGR
jgi:hypothetical protein